MEDSIGALGGRDLELEEVRSALAEQRELAERYRIEAAETRTLFDAMQYRIDSLRERLGQEEDAATSDQEERAPDLIAELRQQVGRAASERDEAHREIQRLEEALAQMRQARADPDDDPRRWLPTATHPSPGAKALWAISLLALAVGALFVVNEPAPVRSRGARSVKGPTGRGLVEAEKESARREPFPEHRVADTAATIEGRRDIECTIGAREHRRLTSQAGRQRGDRARRCPTG